MKLKLNRKYLKTAGFIILIIFIFLMILNYLFFPWYVSSKIIKVPNVQGMMLADAMNTLEQAGLNPIVGDTVFDMKTKNGAIHKQKPLPGEEVKEGRRIYLILSGGKPQIVTPSVIGKTISDAKITFGKVGLQVGAVTFVNSLVEKDKILKQSVPPGIRSDKESKIDLTVSLGPETGTIEVPNLIGKSESEASAILASLGIDIGKKNFQASKEMLPGTILAQYPVYGQKVNPGDHIDIFIAKDSPVVPE